MNISEELRQEINRRRQKDISCAPLSDDEILQLIEDEKKGNPEKVDKDNYPAPKEGPKATGDPMVPETRREGRARAKPSRSFSGDTERFVREWEDFYRDVFGIEKDFSDIKIPDTKEGFDRLIIVARGMTPNKLCAALQSYAVIEKGVADFDIVKSVRRTDRDYAIWVRDGIESDDKLQTKSPNDIIKSGINGMTLQERLLLGLKFFYEDGRHIDVQFGTLCTGSVLDVGGNSLVPWTCWDQGAVRIKTVDFVSQPQRPDSFNRRPDSSPRYGGREVVA